MTGKVGRDAELEKSVNGGSKHLLHLLEDQWFFCNALGGSRVRGEPPPQPPPSPPPSPPSAAAAMPEKDASASVRQLETAPSLLLPPRASCEGAGGIEECGRKLSNSCCSKRMPRQRPPRTDIQHRRCAVPHLAVSWEAGCRKTFHNKKWRSLGDLATMELQGFKDLGFVCDGMNGLSSRLARKEEDGMIYLPEHWFTRRLAPIMIFRLAGCVSGEEMKDLLRFWAKAVACNVWQKSL